MSHNNASEISSSRFQLQQVSTYKLNATAIDTGCQRCQHCMLLLRWPSAKATFDTCTVNQSIPEEKLEEIGSRTCKK